MRSGVGFLLLTIFFNMCGHMLMKQSSAGSIRSIYFPLGISFSGVSVYFYMICLKTFPLSKAFLILSGASYVLIGILSILIFKEKFSWNLFAGYMVVLVGLLIANTQ
jgi:multidrug transporter EmrE-like cation transporter